MILESKTEAALKSADPVAEVKELIKKETLAFETWRADQLLRYDPVTKTYSNKSNTIISRSELYNMFLKDTHR